MKVKIELNNEEIEKMVKAKVEKMINESFHETIDKTIDGKVRKIIYDSETLNQLSTLIKIREENKKE